MYFVQSSLDQFRFFPLVPSSCGLTLGYLLHILWNWEGTYPEKNRTLSSSHGGICSPFLGNRKPKFQATCSEMHIQKVSCNGEEQGFSVRKTSTWTDYLTLYELGRMYETLSTLIFLLVNWKSYWFHGIVKGILLANMYGRSLASSHTRTFIDYYY